MRSAVSYETSVRLYLQDSKTAMLMGTSAVARNSVQGSNRLRLKYRAFILPASCRWSPLHCNACGLSAESTYANTIKEPTGSGNTLLSEKIVTLYNAVLFALCKFGDSALN